MALKKPGLLQMMRAPFFSSVLSPLVAGTFLSAFLTEQFSVFGFLLVLIMGIALHAATNVYNDIFDTLQGTDRINRHRNEFSGGSGIILNYPHLKTRMFWIARISLFVAFMAMLGLMIVIRQKLWPLLWGLYLLSAFFSKYYTAAPIKLAYRGWGEIAVWFAFGPMAILVAAVSQNIGLHSNILVTMPITGISTLSILLIGQLIDLQADTESGKLGVAARKGPHFTCWLYIIVQLLLVFNILFLSFIIENGFYLLFSLIPYILLLGKVWRIISKNSQHPESLKSAAGINVQIHLYFSLLFASGFFVRFIIS